MQEGNRFKTRSLIGDVSKVRRVVAKSQKRVRSELKADYKVNDPPDLAIYLRGSRTKSLSGQHSTSYTKHGCSDSDRPWSISIRWKGYDERISCMFEHSLGKQAENE